GRALLPHVGRGEVDGDPPARRREAGVLERGEDAVAALADGAVGEPDDGPGREAGLGVGLDLDGEGVDAVDGARPDAGEHAVGRYGERASIDTAPPRDLTRRGEKRAPRPHRTRVSRRTATPSPAATRTT